MCISSLLCVLLDKYVITGNPTPAYPSHEHNHFYTKAQSLLPSSTNLLVTDFRECELVFHYKIYSLVCMIERAGMRMKMFPYVTESMTLMMPF